MAVRAVCLLLTAFVGFSNGLSLLEPKNGSYFGVSVDFATTTVSQYLTTTATTPVVWNVFVTIPLNSTTRGYLAQTLPQIAAANAICLLTVEPMAGLSLVTPTAVQELATIINQYQKSGASFMVRYAHEMNGNWFPWGQQPTAYIQSHQMVTSILRNSTCGVAMVWAPNSANGYPWTGGFKAGTAITPAPTAGSADFKLMDTDKDGNITLNDDPYLPYYPGDSWVDWVGMSSFHFGGLSYPFNQNAEAAPNSFVAGFTGTGLNNFYGRFCNDSTHNKPMVITETSAMYNPSSTAGSTDLAIKQNWWQQVFNVQGDSSLGVDISVNFPRIKAIMWFDEIKVEPQAGGITIDWRFSGVQQIRTALAVYIQTPAKATGQKYWLQLNDYMSSNFQITCNGTTGGSTVLGNTTVSNTSSNTTTPTISTANTTTSANTNTTSSTIQGSRSATSQALTTSTFAATGSTSPPPTQTTASSQQTTAQSPPVTRSSGNLAAIIGRRLL